MRILIIEDERALADALEELLRREKYMTDAVYDGRDGLEYARSGIYDCIILDCMLPSIDGFTILKTLRGEKNETPILMLTALSSIRDKVHGLDLGADDYMTKPFSLDELLARIRVITRRRGEVILDELAYCDLVYTISVCELSCKNTEQHIRLNFKENELLKLFLQKPGVIIPKEELITRVWGYDSDTSDNNLEAYISFLRKKMLYVGSKCEIVSHKKIGYMLTERSC